METRIIELNKDETTQLARALSLTPLNGEIVLDAAIDLVSVETLENAWEKARQAVWKKYFGDKEKVSPTEPGFEACNDEWAKLVLEKRSLTVTVKIKKSDIDFGRKPHQAHLATLKRLGFLEA